MGEIYRIDRVVEGQVLGFRVLMRGEDGGGFFDGAIRKSWRWLLSALTLSLSTPPPLLQARRNSPGFRIQLSHRKNAPVSHPALPLLLLLDSNVVMDGPGSGNAAMEHDAGVRRERPWLYASVRS